jgi:exopolyphosphatase/guanosine-5'-triphosphate,3'-diphosphate pyrophosphatase
VALGTARLRGELGTGEMLTRSDRGAVAEVALARAEPIRAMLARNPQAASRVIASGGTVRALARLAMGLHRPSSTAPVSSLQVNQVELPAGQLHELADRLATLDLDARLALPGVQSRRAPLLPIGAVVLSTLVEALGLQRLVVSEWGLREGAVIGALSLPADRRPVPA